MSKTKKIVCLLFFLYTFGHPVFGQFDNGCTGSLLYGIVTFPLTVGNVCFGVFNGVQIVKGTGRDFVPIAGLFTGSLQLALGISGYSSCIQKDDKVLCAVNTGLGSATIILCAWNLIAKKKPKQVLTGWNLYGFPNYNKSLGIAFSINRTF